MENFFSSLKTERTARKTYRLRDEAKADVFDLHRTHIQSETSALDDRLYMRPTEFERQAGLA